MQALSICFRHAVCLRHPSLWGEAGEVLSHFDGAEMFDLMCREHDEFSNQFYYFSGLTIWITASMAVVCLLLPMRKEDRMQKSLIGCYASDVIFESLPDSGP